MRYSSNEKITRNHLIDIYEDFVDSTFCLHKKQAELPNDTSSIEPILDKVLFAMACIDEILEDTIEKSEEEIILLLENIQDTHSLAAMFTDETQLHSGHYKQYFADMTCRFKHL